MTYYTWLDGPLGRMLVAATDAGLAGAWFEGQKYFPAIGTDWRERPGHPVLRQAVAQLRDYFAGRRTAFDLPLAPAGTPFQQQVWKALRGIRYGGSSTYGTLARRMRAPAAARAVGAAVGRNPLSVVVPCHRVLGADGSLTGYAGGLARKRKLLSLERAGSVRP